MVQLPKVKLPSPGRVYIPNAHMPRLAGKVRYRFVNKGHRIANYMARWEKMFLHRAGASIRVYAINSFKIRENRDIRSTPGSAPFLHEKKAKFIRRAIMFAVDLVKGSVLVGTDYTEAGLWGAKHEKAGYWKTLRGNKGPKGYYIKRPFMRNAFKRWIRFGLPKILSDTRNKILGR